jgi:hypothetical protein
MLLLHDAETGLEWRLEVQGQPAQHDLFDFHDFALLKTPSIRARHSAEW